MAELASRIGKRILYPNLTWTRPGLEEEEQEAQKAQTINFGNGHRLSSLVSAWDGESMDFGSDASGGHDDEQKTPEPAPFPSKTPSGTPRIVRNRYAGPNHTTSAQAAHSQGSLMQRLGLELEPERTSSATSQARTEDDQNPSLSDGENPDIRTYPAMPVTASSTFSKSTNELLAITTPNSLSTSETVNAQFDDANDIPGLSIRQTHSEAAFEQQSVHQEHTSATSRASNLITGMRQLLVPLVVRKANQSASSSSFPSGQSAHHSDLAQKARSVITDDICEQFIHQAIVSAASLEKTGSSSGVTVPCEIKQSPNGQHSNQATELRVASRTATPLPPGLGITTKSPPSTSGPSAAIMVNDSESGKDVPPTQAPPTAPRSVQDNEGMRLSYRAQDSILQYTNSVKGKEREIDPHGPLVPPLGRYDNRRAPHRGSRSNSPQSTAAFRRSVSPGDYARRPGRRDSRSRSRERRYQAPHYVQRKRSSARSRGNTPPSRREDRRQYSPPPPPTRTHRMPSPPPLSRYEGRRRNSFSRSRPPSHSNRIVQSPTASASSSRAPIARDRRRTKSRSLSRSPSPSSTRFLHRLPKSDRRYSPIRRGGPPRGWSRTPPPRGEPHPRKYHHNSSITRKRKSRSPESSTHWMDYTNGKRRASGSDHGAGSFRNGHSFDRRRDYLSHSRREMTPPPPSASSSTFSRRDLSSPPEPENRSDWDTYPTGQTCDDPVLLDYSSSSIVHAGMDVDYKETVTPFSNLESGQVMDVDEDWKPPGLSFAATSAALVKPNATQAFTFTAQKRSETMGKHSRARAPQPRSVFDELLDEDRKPDINELEKLVASLRPQLPPAHHIPHIPSSTSTLYLEPTSAFTIMPGTTSSLPLSVASSRLATPAVQQEHPEPGAGSWVPAPPEKVLVGTLETTEGFEIQSNIQLEAGLQPDSNDPEETREQAMEDSREKDQDAREKQDQNGIPEQVHAPSAGNVSPGVQSEGLQDSRIDDSIAVENEPCLPNSAESQNSVSSDSIGNRRADNGIDVGTMSVQHPIHNGSHINGTRTSESSPDFPGENKSEAGASMYTTVPADALACHTVPGVWLVQQGQSGIAMTDQSFEIDQETALLWDLGISPTGASINPASARIGLPRTHRRNARKAAARRAAAKVREGSHTTSVCDQPESPTVQEYEKVGDPNGVNSSPDMKDRAAWTKDSKQQCVTKPKVKLQLLCFSTDSLDKLDWNCDLKVLLTQSQSWPGKGDYIIILNPEQASERTWMGRNMASHFHSPLSPSNILNFTLRASLTYICFQPCPAGSGQPIYLESAVRFGTNVFRLLQLTDLSDYTFMILAQANVDDESGAAVSACSRDTIEPALSNSYDTYFDKLRDELLEWQRKQTENSRPEISGSVALEPLPEDDGDAHW